MIDLYTSPTPNGHKISCALEAMGLDYNALLVNLMEGEQHKPDFLEISPNGKIPAIKSRYIIIGGVFSSFLTMFFGATGPFIAGMVKTMKLNPLSHTATHAALMSMQHAVKVLVFGFMGFSFSDYFHIILLMIISGFIGTYIGKKVLIKFGQKYFKIFLNSILTIISIYLILNGFVNYDFTFYS